MRRTAVIGLLALALIAAIAPAPRRTAVDLVSAAVPWVADDDAATPPIPEAAPRAAPTGERAGADIGTPESTGTAESESTPRGDHGAADDGDHADGPPPDLEISDDLPIPPLAPGVGTLDEGGGGVARPATSTGPHWVPFKGNRILWCVYRGAGRCDGHHPYPAIDIDMAPGTPVYASGPGTVYESCNRGSACGGYGNHVRIRHLNNIRSVYGHFTRSVVRRGQTVRTGTLLGYSGCTGNCNGAHLHYEERNAADQSIQIGQMQGFTGQRIVTYPNVWGYTSWTGIPPDRLRIRNDFFPEDDRDDDGTLDRRDRCLNSPGPTSTRGCPLSRRLPESTDAAVGDGTGNLRLNAATVDGTLTQLTGFARGWDFVDRAAPGPAIGNGEIGATRATGGQAWAVAVDVDGTLWSGRSPQSNWQWAPIGSQGGGFAGTPTVAATTDSRVVVHAVDVTGSLWRAVLDPVLGWTWTDLGKVGGGFAGQTPTSFFTGRNNVVTAITDVAGRLHLFDFAADGQSTVSHAARVGGGLTASAPAMITDRAGLPSVFAIGRDGHLWRYLESYAGTWVWIDHGAVPGGDGAKGLTAWRSTGHNIGVAMIDASGRLRITTQTSTLGFAWRNLGPQGPLAGIGSLSSGVDGRGVPDIFIASGGQVRRVVVRGAFPSVLYSPVGPAIR